MIERCNQDSMQMCKVVNTIKLFLVVSLVWGKCDGMPWATALFSWQSQSPFWSQIKQLAGRAIKGRDKTMDKWAAESQITAANLSLEIINLQILVSTPIKSIWPGVQLQTQNIRLKYHHF